MVHLNEGENPKEIFKVNHGQVLGFTSSPLIIIILTVDFGERERKREREKERERESVFERERGRQRKELMSENVRQENRGEQTSE